MQTIDWHLSNFSSRYHPKEVTGSGQHEKLIAPTRLREPFPHSEILTTVHGNVTAYWRIKLDAWRINPACEQWRFHLDLLRTEIKDGDSDENVVGSTSGVAAPNGSDVNERAKLALAANIQFQHQLFLLTSSGNITCYSTDPVECSFSGANPPPYSTPLGWPHQFINKTKSNDVDAIVKDLATWMTPGDDAIHIRVYIFAVKCTPVPSQAKAGTPDPTALMTNFISDFSRLLKSGDESDVVIKCGSDSFPVHKFILSLRSPVFKAMLDADMTEARSGIIKIEDSEPEVVKQLLDFIYTGKIQLNNLDHDQIIGLMAAGDKYGLADLKEYCFQHLLTKLNDEVCAKLAVAAHLHNAEPSQKALVYNYVAERWKKFGTDKKFQALVKQYPAAFLKE